MEIADVRPLEIKAAIGIAKAYITDVLSDESISYVGLEETELERGTGIWKITIGFFRPWNTPRTRAQEVLEQLGSTANLRRAFKVVEVASNGSVLSMKDRRD